MAKMEQADANNMADVHLHCMYVNDNSSHKHMLYLWSITQNRQ